MKTMEREVYKFLEEAGPIFFITPSAGRAIGLEKELPDFHIVCGQDSKDAGLMRNAGLKVFCLGKETKNAGKILLEEEAIKYIKDHSPKNNSNIITFKPSPMIEKACERHGFRYLGNDWRVSHSFEDKIKFAKITSELGLRNASSRTMRIEKAITPELDFSDGRSYVLQFSRGYSGNSTFRAKNGEDLEKIWKSNEGRQVKISDFIEGESYTFDVCIGESGTFISQPILQITGFSKFNRNALGTCGNDYSYGKSLDRGVREKMEQMIRRVSDELLSVGYRGILGFDFIANGNESDLIEVNPRLVGSVPVFTKLQLFSGSAPFLLLHILSFLDFDFSKMQNNIEGGDFDFSQIIVRNTASDSRIMESSLPTGIYEVGTRDINLLEETYFPGRNMAENEFFLACVGKGEIIDPDMEYANMQFPYGIMKTRDSFTEKFQRISEEILNKITLKQK